MRQWPRPGIVVLLILVGVLKLVEIEHEAWLVAMIVVIATVLAPIVGRSSVLVTCPAILAVRPPRLLALSTLLRRS